MLTGTDATMWTHRLPTLTLSLVSLVFNSYAIALLVVWLDSLESDTTSAYYDPSEGTSLIIFLGTSLRSWSALNACVAACGSIGAFIVRLSRYFFFPRLLLY